MEKKNKGIQGIMIIVGLAKAFFMSVTQLAWGLVSLFGLNLVLAYFLKENMPYEISLQFIRLEGIIIDNIMIFFWLFFIWYSFSYINEVNKECQ